MLTRTNELIESGFVTLTPASSLSLGHDAIEATWNGRRHAGRGHAILRFQPRLQLIIEAQFTGAAAEGVARSSIGVHQCKLRFGKSGAMSTAHILSVKETPHSATVNLLPNPQKMATRFSRRHARAMTFHILNFPDFFSLDKDSSDINYIAEHSQRRLGRLILRDHHWHIEIQATAHTSQLVKLLKTEGGFGITHVGRLTRIGCRSFTLAAAQSAMRELQLLLSFACGSPVTPALCIGVDGNDLKVFEDWGVRTAISWESHCRWFDIHHGQSIAAVYPGFRKLLCDQDWQDAVASALYWYLQSNRAGDGAGIDSGIILAHAALDRLASTCLRQHSIALPKKSSSAERMRRAFQIISLPGDIPRELSCIYRAKRRRLWQDSPEAITRIRNELVHPQGRLGVDVHQFLPEIWTLAQWYLELWLLRLSEYRGVYSKRLKQGWVGEVENVPWSA